MSENSDLLDRAIAAWRAAPGPELAALVARAGKLAGEGRDAITGLDVAERDAAWAAVEKAGDPADLDRLLAVLVETRCETAVVRMAKLAKRPRDPRLVDRLVAYVTANPDHASANDSPVPFTSGPNRKFWTAMFALLDARGDASLVPRLEVVIDRPAVSNFQKWLATRVAKTQALLGERAPAKPGADAKPLAAAIAAREATRKPAADTGDALWAAVWAAPADDAPRVVLADFLTERGDPRGEFIALQLARAGGTLDAAGKKREKELLKRHKKLWLGPIAPLMQSHYQRFERGFIVTCSIEPNAELEATLGKHPAWSTIKLFFVQHYARTTGKPLIAMLARHGAEQTTTVTNKSDPGIL